MVFFPPVAMASSQLPTMEFRAGSGRLCLLWVMGIALLQSLHRIANAQTGSGFINIDCGAPPGFAYLNPATNLTFQSDANLISTGVAVSTTDSSVSDLTTLRYFPAASSPRKNCYDIPATVGRQYMVRAWFYFGGYTSVPASGINFELAVEETFWTPVTIDTTPNTYSTYEVTLITTKPSISVCLIGTDSSDPFINSLEVRPANSGGYIYLLGTGKQSNIMPLIVRSNFGEEATTYRFPQDSFDRIWPPLPRSDGDTFTSIFTPGYPNSPTQIINDGDYEADEPPSIVMQSAVTDPNLLNFSVTLNLYNNPSIQVYAYLFFAEIDNTGTSGLSRVMDFEPNFDYKPPPGYVVNLTNVVPPFTVYQYGVKNYTVLETDPSLVFTLVPDASTGLPPLVNALEVYQVIPLGSPTNADDVTALAGVKLALNYSRWTGDPCNPVPWDEVFCTDNAVTALDLSGKGLSGPIPTAISGLAALRYLNLSDNQFSGPLPTWIAQLSSLETLDVSNNNLDGTFPATYIAKITDFRYSGNLQLQCVPSGNAVCSPPTGTTSPSPPSAPPTGTTSSPAGTSGGNGTKSKSKSSIGPVIGGVVGGVLVLLFIVLLVLWFCCRKKPTESTHHPAPQGQHHPATKGQQYALSTIREATNNFARKIGQGGFGPVYYGRLKGQEVAVKVMSEKSRQGLSEFSNEIDLLSTVHYKKLVSLVGYCQEGEDLILLYEYMSGGDLRARLYGSKEAQDSPLNWTQRLQIALDAAKGLEYLHHGCNPAIFHRDVKSSNILLNNKLEAKVADFGLSKLTVDGNIPVQTMVKGTPGYLDPEYYTTGLLTDKSDVYSFGVVLLEILCGLPPTVQEGPIVERVRHAMNTGSLLPVVDPALRGNYKVESLWRFADIAMTCVTPAASARPGMTSVVTELTQTLELESGERRGESAQSSRTTFSGNIPTNPTSQPIHASPSYSTDQPSQIFLGSIAPQAR